MHIAGFDTLRLVSALWVLLSHAGGLPVEPVLRIAHAPASLVSMARSLNGIAFNGVAAVVVFFIISGFCIHFPSRRGTFQTVPFLVRRFLRVGLPLIVAVLLGEAIFGNPGFLNPILWSLYCELIYYALYPLLLRAAAKLGWLWLLLMSIGSAAALAAIPDSNNGSFWAYGIAWTWVLGLPLWLTGVLVAENFKLDANPPSPGKLWISRGAVWIYSALAVALQFHSGLHYKITMLLFCPLATAWLMLEVRNASAGNESPILEKAGRASYSIYLCHLFGLSLAPALSGRPQAVLLSHLARIFLALVISLCFYIFVEDPAHRFAKLASRRLDFLRANPLTDRSLN